MNTKALGTLALLSVILLIFLWANQPRAVPAPAMTAEKAIDMVIAAHPQLAAYRTTSLPPSSIESKQTPDGWYVGFIQRGSGVPGILNARCYLVENESTVALKGVFSANTDTTVENIDLETCAASSAATTTPHATTTAPVTQDPTSSSFLPYGNVALKLGQTAHFKDMSIRPVSVEEDSRCPQDVQCIQAGTVRVKIEVVSAAGTHASIVTVGKEFTTEGRAITLLSVSPDKFSKIQITDAQYIFKFSVVPQTTTVSKSSTGACFVGGCSDQLCSDQADVVSTCEYTASYACYKSAVCERQPSGECGWTPSASLKACLANS